MIQGEEVKRSRRKKSWIEAALRLREQRRDAMARLAEQRRGDAFAEGWQDRDSPSEDEIRDVEYGHRDALRSEILAITEALCRIRAGTYGSCTRCGGEIDPKRLAMEPAVALCIVCQNEVEGQPRLPSL